MACNVANTTDWSLMSASETAHLDNENWEIDDDDEDVDVVCNNKEQHLNNLRNQDDNWEILEDDDTTNLTREKHDASQTEIYCDLSEPSAALDDYSIVTSCIQGPDQSSVVCSEFSDHCIHDRSSLRRNRSGSISSPDFRVLVFEDDGFTIVSNPGTVLSSWSSSTSGTSNPARSFRDILMTKPKKSTIQGLPESQSLSNNQPTIATNNSSIKKSKFVVVRTSNLKRCAKSSNDLSVIDEYETSTQYDDDLYDDHGVEFYYSNKAMGARGRSNGLKLRPDESKRKDIILQKKNLQRQSSGVGK